MGKPNGFMLYEREENRMIPPEERLKTFAEFKKPLDEDERRRQGARCMNCGVPFCQSAIELKGMVTGCPLHNLIPEWNDEIYNKHYHHALSRLLKTNPFPEFTGRVCPALCEKACINGIDGEPVTIHDNELFIIETAFDKGWMQPQPPKERSDKKIAVIGAGPAGLALAHDLNARGHNVTVYEREDKPGGLLQYGIPNMKLDKNVIERRRRLIEEEGIQFVLNTDVGRDISLEQLEKDYDAIAVCTGSKQARGLPALREGLDGALYAVDYLTQMTKNLYEGTPYTDARGKNVIIVGGGDTGNDCCGTALRQGAASVTQLEMMPKAPEERAANNLWPEWPKVNKTDYGQQEAIYEFGHDPRIYETTIKQIYEQDGHIVGVQTAKVGFKDGKLETIEGTEKDLPCDLLIIAAGFTGIEPYVKEALELETTGRNTIATPQGSYATDNPKVFAAGDARRGQSLVVWAIAEGKHAAKQIDASLMGYTNLE